MSRFPFYRRRPGIHKRATNERSRPAERVANFPDAFAQSRRRGHSVTYKLLMTSGRSLARGINYTARRRRRRRECPALHVVTGGDIVATLTVMTIPTLLHRSTSQLRGLRLPPPLGSLFASLTFQNEKSPGDAGVKRNRRFIISRPSSEN